MHYAIVLHHAGLWLLQFSVAHVDAAWWADGEIIMVLRWKKASHWLQAVH